MNRVAWYSGIVWIVLGVGAIGAAVKPSHAPVRGNEGAAPNGAGDPTPSRYAVDALGREVVTRDPFRFGRHPAQTPYDPARGTAPPMAPAGPPAPPKPMLSLVGVISGSIPQAILEGLPGSAGARAVRVGDVVGGLSITAIARDTVRVAGMDTTWVLTVREPWKK